MTEAIDRFGECPNCKKSFNGGDVLLNISSLNCNSGKSENELIKLAANYGWTPHNKINFSTLISHELEDGRTLLECPNVTCRHVFDKYTGVEYRNMFDAKRDAPILKQGEFPTKAIPTSDPEHWKKLLHATKDNREEIELEIHNKIKQNLEKDDCPFDL